MPWIYCELVFCLTEGTVNFKRNKQKTHPKCLHGSDLTGSEDC